MAGADVDVWAIGLRPDEVGIDGSSCIFTAGVLEYMAVDKDAD
jgi:hypothetical protein